MQKHLKKVYGTLSISMLAATAGAYVHLFTNLLSVSTVGAYLFKLTTLLVRKMLCFKHIANKNSHFFAEKILRS